ncbi:MULTISPECIES: hypothetical protein [Streptomyces]|nr:hypothetical protein [Streptomyces scabiei]MDX3116569.1 hypothetical protein [Streptomyces scabiei]
MSIFTGSSTDGKNGTTNRTMNGTKSGPRHGAANTTTAESA